MLIPEVRDEMRAMIKTLDAMADRLEVLEGELYRRKPVRRADAKKVSPPAKLIRAYANENPHMDYADIASELNISAGRVSEALAGKRV